jgi:hypothetical protein
MGIARWIILLAMFLAACASAGEPPIPTAAESDSIQSDAPLPFYLAAKAKDKENGASCSASGAPDCGGKCSITCKVGQEAVCNPGTCRWTSAPGPCICERHTTCECQ